ncbi:hypothetical protein C479_13233 [Halovivax asiaticus JCM 14624]|uniref:Uncharacterized protein n=1 Tax=Halovivax asiaticus JCM 14624 TaxID=1227490 RepID=M0BF67_9EURY|nr:hypothetical protein C479_13233 [Halovivax asiaticus JCM 14624]
MDHAHQVRDVVFLREQQHHDVRRVDVRRRDDRVRAIDIRVLQRVVVRRVVVQDEAIVLHRRPVRAFLVLFDNDDIVAVGDGSFDQHRPDISSADNDYVHECPFVRTCDQLLLASSVAAS